MELENTLDLMLSPDYKDRLKAEYWQTKARYEKLKRSNTEREAYRLTKWEAYRITSRMQAVAEKSKTPMEVLQQQERVMEEYLHLLELRAVLEDVELEEGE